MQNNLIEISNRRYIGSKSSLLDEILKVIEKYFKEEKITFFEPFGGTGVVSNSLYNKGNKIIINDLLFSNYIPYVAWFKNEDYDLDKIKKQIDIYNKIDPNKLKENYISKYFSDKYFHNNDAKLIGYIRDDLEKNKEKFNEKEFCILLSSLLYSTDKIANTCGHFESFLKKMPIEKGLNLKIPNINFNGGSEIYCEDANNLVDNIISDVSYIDPPYNARQYINFYHVLENIARWEKPTDFEGNSMKFKRDHLKSEYSKSNAKKVFKELISKLKTKLIIVSYNNTYNAKSIASNNKITEEDLMEILNEKGKVSIVEIPYKHFNAGKTKFDNHKENLYICEVYNGQ